MELYVACDICGHRYVLPQEREGRNLKCKSCGVPFEVSRDSEYDPDSSEFEELEEDEDTSESSLAPLWKMATVTSHCLAGLVTLSMLVWMATLLFKSPVETARGIAGGVVRKL